MIDFGFWGPAPLGFDLGQLITGEVQLGERPAAALPGDEQECLAAYVAGLRAEGCDVDVAAVERGLGEILREGREDAPPPGVLRARALGQQQQADPQRQASESKDSGARRGLGWVSVLVMIALGLGATALVVALVNDDDSPTITRTDVDLQRPEAPSDSAPAEVPPSDSSPSGSEPAAPDSSGSEPAASGSRSTRGEAP